MFIDAWEIARAHSGPDTEDTMREPPVRLPPLKLERRGGIVREVAFFLIAFATMFGGAFLALDLIV
jgi:hypothetical protein